MIEQRSSPCQILSYQNNKTQIQVLNQQNWIKQKHNKPIKYTKTQSNKKKNNINRAIFDQLSYVQRQYQSSSQTQSNKNQDLFQGQIGEVISIKRIQSEDVQFQIKGNFFQRIKSNQSALIRHLLLIKQRLQQINLIQQNGKNKCKQLNFCYKEVLFDDLFQKNLFAIPFFKQIQQTIQLKNKKQKVSNHILRTKIQQLQRKTKYLMIFNKLVYQQKQKQKYKTDKLNISESISNKLKSFNSNYALLQNKLNFMQKQISEINRYKIRNNYKNACWSQIQLSQTSSDQIQQNHNELVFKEQLISHKQLKNKPFILKETKIKLKQIKKQKFEYQFQEEVNSQNVSSEEDDFVLDFSICSKSMSNVSVSKTKTMTIQNKDSEIVFLDEQQSQIKPELSCYKIKAQTLILKNSQNQTQNRIDRSNTLKYQRSKTLRSQQLANQESNTKNFKMTSSTINNNYQDTHKAEIYQKVLNQPIMDFKQFFLQKKHLQIDRQLYFTSKNFVKSQNKFKKSYNTKKDKFKTQEYLSYRNTYKVQDYPLIYSQNQSNLNQIQNKAVDSDLTNTQLFPFKKTHEPIIEQQKRKILKQNICSKQQQEKMHQKQKEITSGEFKGKTLTQNEPQSKKKQVQNKSGQISKQKEVNSKNESKFNILQNLKPVLQKNIFENNKNGIAKFGEQANIFNQGNNNQSSNSNLISFNPNEMKFAVNTNANNYQSFKSFGNIIGNAFINGNSSQRFNSNVFGNSNTNPLNVLASVQSSGGNIFGRSNNNMMNVNPALLQPRK